ncbi:hypothetical protein AB0G86_14055 [Streptomyces scabiei]|uniref:hypothetical protein n=1 Tax=Streptomyces scabiei TaxID=1930 RepID=UPI0033C149AB
MTQNADRAAIVPAGGHGDRAAGTCPGATREPRRAVGGFPRAPRGGSSVRPPRPSAPSPPRAAPVVLGGWVTPDAENDPEAGTVGMLPRTDDPFVARGRREAIMRDARHPAADRLFLDWQLSKERQTSDGWSVRTDVAPPAGLKRGRQYRNADIDGFPAFMRNRAAAERMRQQMTVYVGEVVGDPAPGRLGTHPGTTKP